jgi:hypothetical protein
VAGAEVFRLPHPLDIVLDRLAESGGLLPASAGPPFTAWGDRPPETILSIGEKPQRRVVAPVSADPAAVQLRDD